ncbi:hypothetical protein ACFX13_042159 [Malus domestica]
MSDLHLFDDLVVLFFLLEYYYNNDLRLGKVNFLDAICILIKIKNKKNQDVMMSNVGRVESEARENLRSFVAAMLAAEAASVSARPTVGMMSPRKRVCEVDIDEAGPSTYLEELD